MSDSRKLVYVSGAPGSGKTSLAIPLAAALGYALLTKDRIKETMHDAFGAPEPDRAWSRRLGGAAMELLWALAADAPAVVIEANFRPRSEYERAKLSGLAARPVEVHCACPPGLALQRYNARITHPVACRDDARAGGHGRVRPPGRNRRPGHRGHYRPGRRERRCHRCPRALRRHPGSYAEDRRLSPG